jgi:hypothetical protein
MGGRGSGNHYHWHRRSKKTTVEASLSIDANRWMREGILRASVHLWGNWRWTYRSGSGFSVNYDVNTFDLLQPVVRLSYSWTWRRSKEPQSESYLVQLTTTQPRFGGVRWWFVCPLVLNGAACNRRVGKLYLPPAARYFGCRQCHDLTYTSSQEAHSGESLLKHIAAEMGCSLRVVKRLMRRRGYSI